MALIIIVIFFFILLLLKFKLEPYWDFVICAEIMIPFMVVIMGFLACLLLKYGTFPAILSLCMKTQ